MSIHRHAAKRDANEPTIRQRFAEHGWHTEPRSSSGGWDIDCYAPFGCYARAPLLARVVTHVDVKMPDGKVTPAQEEKWKVLRAKGIPVYVVRTAEDVDALVRGELAAWEPSTKRLAPGNGMSGGTKRALATVTADAGKRLSVVPRAPRSGYTPPRAKPVDAAKEADETFAPPAEPWCQRPGCIHRGECPEATP